MGSVYRCASSARSSQHEQFITAASLLHLFLDCLKHLNTKKMCSKNNESKQQVTLQIMECEPFLPLSE